MSNRRQQSDFILDSASSGDTFCPQSTLSFEEESFVKQKSNANEILGFEIPQDAQGRLFGEFDV